LKFNEFHLSAELLAEVEKAGFVEASPIQEQTIPLAMEGKDVIGQAQTGTGKTAAFGFPTLERINTENPFIQALVIAPTRELAVQSQEEWSALLDQMLAAQDRFYYAIVDMTLIRLSLFPTVDALSLPYFNKAYASLIFES